MQRDQVLLSQIDILQEFIKQQFGVSTKIGAELEFYLIAESQSPIDVVLSRITLEGFRIEKEKGRNQYECVFNYTDSLRSLIKQINTMKMLATSLAQQNNATATFAAKPYPDDYGNALHLHISLHDKNGFNTFTKPKELGNVISGMLDISLEAVYLLCRNPIDYLRFTPRFLSPTHLCWGANNRTTLLRIPTSIPMHKRIEFRLPPSSADPDMAIYIALIGIIHGLSSKLPLPPQIYGNAFDTMYQLPILPKNLNEAKNIFEKNAKILHYTKKVAPTLILDNYL